ncbi:MULTISPECIES: hypothetical protein [unclassified Streptomyces]|uniref:hypothetical protein n=1 Tax=unclassified Streptomyces TaxID=2593676 RepID=UPI0033F4633E
MVDLQQRVTAFTETASPISCQIFLASCVERASASFFWGLSGKEERSQDAEVYLSDLNALWQTGPEAAGPSESEEIRQRIYAFPELTQEEEPSGVGAYVSDALSALYYAYSYMATFDGSWVAYTSSCLADSAHFLDRAAGSGNSISESEVAEQLECIDLLSSDVGTAIASVATLREKSQAAGRHRVALLQTLSFR